ncbi:AAA family ATPase [Pseudoruegeria sp. SK021]|uniref:AAA family ATPase n=1 Tax=Pseudoruegeria sp. SK021 TaxID=1933035 RepID=UPI000A329C20|nr:AAA family ATPase [Pseudoruegeria sp. SK021]
MAKLIPILMSRGQAGRSITAIAGAPGSGKSTLAEALVTALNREEPGSAAVLPMDGYHYDDLVLNIRGWRARKGAPHTFDVAGFAAMLQRLVSNADAEIAVPVFDRSLELARAGARIIAQSVRHVIVEGNYLLLDSAPWAALRPLYDTTVFLDVPEPQLIARLETRWAALSPADRAAKMDGNDLPNVRQVVRESVAPEFRVTSV